MTKWGKLFTGAKKEILGASNGIGQKTFDKLVTSANQLGRKASLEDVATHAGLKKGSTQWLLDNYGSSAKSKTPLTLSNGHFPTEQAQINTRRAELKQKYGSVAGYKAQKEEMARRGAAEAKIAQQNPGGLRVNNSSLDEFDKAHGVSDAEMRKRRIETAASKISNRGIENTHGELTQFSRAQNQISQMADTDSSKAIKKSVERHNNKRIENLKRESRRESAALRNSVEKPTYEQKMAEARRLGERRQDSEAAFNGKDKTTYQRYGTETVTENVKTSQYGRPQFVRDSKGNIVTDETGAAVEKTVTVERGVRVPKSQEELKAELSNGKPPASGETPTASSAPQSGGAETHAQSGGDTLLANMQARAAKANSSADKYMFGTRLSNKIQEFETDMAGVKDGNFKEVADKYGLSGTKEGKLRRQFEKQINAEAAQGHTTMDWVYGNDVPQKAIGGVAIAGAMSAIFGSGQKSNSDLYSNPFQ